MTKEQVIALAQHCGLPDPMVFYAAYERFANLVAAAEREAAQERVVNLFADMETPYLPDIIAAIRAKSES
jgi:hypothetical protein